MGSTHHGLILKQGSHDLFLEHYSFRSTSMSDGLTSSPKLLADDNSLFSVDQKINSAANDLNSGLIKIRDWDFQ